MIADLIHLIDKIAFSDLKTVNYMAEIHKTKEY